MSTLDDLPSTVGDPARRSRETGELLYRSGALTFGDFVARSGRQTPYFVNTGNVGGAAALARLGRLYADAIVETFGDRVDVLFGPAYKGIALSVTAGIALAQHHGQHVGVAYDRKESKDHGEGGSLIGHRFVDGDRVVIVEDVTTAGTSIRDSIPKLEAAADVDVVGLVVGVDRQEHGEDKDRSALEQVADTFGLTTVALTRITDIVEHLGTSTIDGRRVMTDEDLARIAAYRRRYGAGGS